ncbi:MAG: type II toxin-antitoxin system RelE/ParE family toxin [Tannerellaceae bacterium]|jgi:mRNA interferase RelE/StbE|nr:type II toxin-antitoxin system RelE/ParE family toxin [Tannerellaceae bacterium]
MKQYKVILSDKVQKSIKNVSDDYLIKIHKELSLLSLNPRPPGYIKLVGSKNACRVRVGVYRIIYTIKDEILTVEVIKIDHRGNVYR